jgi:hypothetical protein
MADPMTVERSAAMVAPKTSFKASNAKVVIDVSTR